MPKLVRVNLEQRKELFEKLKAFASELKAKHGAQQVILFGSWARGEVHEGSDMDLVIVGEFRERFPYRIGHILDLTDLPIEPLVYTPEEFEAMKMLILPNNMGRTFKVLIQHRGIDRPVLDGLKFRAFFDPTTLTD